jgi:hypothetical protein
MVGEGTDVVCTPVQRLATCWGVGIQTPVRGEILTTRPDRPRSPPSFQPSVKWIPVLLTGGEWPRRGVDQPFYLAPS